MSTFSDFPELLARERQAELAAQLLERAAKTVVAFAPGETWQDQAHRLRGAASYARSAADELLTTVGFLEAASVAANAGLLDGVELPTDPQATEDTER